VTSVARHLQVGSRLPLEGQVGLVTGGAGGLGSALARVLTGAGARIVSLDQRDSQDATANVRGDLRSAEDVAGAIQRTLSEFQRLDFVVNNAGVDLTAPVTEIDVEAWDRILDVNLRAPFIVARAAFEAMRPGGSIVNVVSTAAKRAWANATAYHASKWGLLGLSHALHVEGRERDLRVTAVIAGGMRTPFLLDRFPDIDVSTLLDPESVAQTVAHVLQLPRGVTIPEVTVISMKETSWP
jgi:NAD(P)-dependent dehydrogenase (short-subunit alcohol dehydrogenase family)